MKSKYSRKSMVVVAGTVLLLLVFHNASAQCFQNPTGETSVGLRNASSHFLTFYIDDVNMGGVPSGDRSVDLTVSPGEHRLRADAVVDGETVSASRTATIPAGYVCTWTVTDPPKVRPGNPTAFKDALPSEAVVPIVGLNGWF